MSEMQFDDIYHEYKKLVYNVCLHYVLNPEDAQDISQEVFVKVYQHLHQFDPGSASLKTWVYRICINQCLDFIKAKKSKKRFGFLTSLFHGKTNEPLAMLKDFNHPGVAAENKEEMQDLFRAIHSLPENQQTALILTRIEDRSQKEVAEIMNMSVKAVESLLQRAKQALIKKLRNSEGF
jgi:RNA polymerase sigma-70 factor, ECF subfamily